MSPTDRRSEAYPGRLAAREATLVEARRKAAGIDTRLPQVGLALSGGGIRSATFGLGLIRALGRAGLLRRIDFLSTVSGGGYVGSYLGALYARDPAAGVSGNRPAAVEHALASPASWPLRRLRENGRYLSPNGSGDLLLAGAVMLRNWLAVQVVVVAAVLTLFVAADLVRIALGSGVGAGFLRDGTVAQIWWSAWIALPPIVFAIWVVPCAWGYWLLRRPGRGWGWSAWSVPLVILLSHPSLRSAVIRLDVGNASSIWDALAAPVSDALGASSGSGWAWVQVLALLSSVLAPAWVALAWLSARMRRRDERHQLSVWLSSGLVATAALAVLALLDSLGQTLYAQFWSGSAARWIAAIPAAIVALVPFGQKVLGALGSDSDRDRRRAVIGALSLVVGLLLATAFVVAIAALGDAIVWKGERPRESAPIDQGDLLAVLLLLAALSWCLGRAFGFLNDSTLAPIYAARLRRAYLGASNPVRERDGRLHAVTRDVEGDEIELKDYRPWKEGGPLHLLNVTLNETTGGSSQVEQRDRRGLGMAFGPAGLSVGVLHHALWDERRPGDFAAGLEPVPLPGRFAVFCTGRHDRFYAEPLSLSRIVAISGAAVSTGLGSRTSLGLSLLLGLLNLRLGHWWYSGIDPRNRDAPSALRRLGRRLAARLPVRGLRPVPAGGPPPAPAEPARPAARRLGGALGRSVSRHFPVQAHLLHELLARFPGPASRNWYLSDGGHFENSGCYELIRRRLPLIIVADCGADPEYELSDLAQLVRKARLDFGARIEPADPVVLDRRVDPLVRRFFASPDLPKRRRPEGGRTVQAPNRRGFDDGDGEPVDRIAWKPRRSAGHALLCFVHYDDDPARRSVLLWLKPSLLGTEPADVLNYALEHESFPQESTADQFFDEAQWESYHRLGELIGERIFGGVPAGDRWWHPSRFDTRGLWGGDRGGPPRPPARPAVDRV